MPERAPECWNGNNSFIRQRARFLHIGCYEHTHILARIPSTIDVTFRSIDIYNREVFSIMIGFGICVLRLLIYAYVIKDFAPKVSHLFPRASTEANPLYNANTYKFNDMNLSFLAT